MKKSNYYKYKQIEIVLLCLVGFFSMSIVYQLNSEYAQEILSNFEIYLFSLGGLLLVYIWYHSKTNKYIRENKIDLRSKKDNFYKSVPYIILLLVAFAQADISNNLVLYYSCLFGLVLFGCIVLWFLHQDSKKFVGGL